MKKDEPCHSTKKKKNLERISWKKKIKEHEF